MLCVCVSPYTYACTPRACVVSTTPTRRHRISSNWSYGWLSATLWVLGADFGSEESSKGF